MCHTSFEDKESTGAVRMRVYEVEHFFLCFPLSLPLRTPNPDGLRAGFWVLQRSGAHSPSVGFGPKQKKTEKTHSLVAPHRAISRYYCCEVHAPLEGPKPKIIKVTKKWLKSDSGDSPQSDSKVTQTHLCDTPFGNVSRDICAIPSKTNTKEFCDTITTSLARCEKYRCWASKREREREREDNYPNSEERLELCSK